jgi:hypothetical protein
MWTSKNRARYDRSKLRYPSDPISVRAITASQCKPTNYRPNALQVLGSSGGAAWRRRKRGILGPACCPVLSGGHSMAGIEGM